MNTKWIEFMGSRLSELGYPINVWEKEVMDKESLEYDKSLFFNDLEEYQDSKEGQLVSHAIEHGSDRVIELALDIYWHCRNSVGFTYA